MQALAQGMLDAIMNRNVESLFRPKPLQWDAYLERQDTKVRRTQEHLEKVLAANSPEVPIDLGTITLGCTLAYLTQRLGDDGWRETCPALSRWLDVFIERESMRASAPPALPPAHSDPRQN